MFKNRLLLFGVFWLAILFSSAAVVSPKVNDSLSQLGNVLYLTDEEEVLQEEPRLTESKEITKTEVSEEKKEGEVAKAEPNDQTPEVSRLTMIELSVDKLAPKNIDPELKKVIVNTAYQAEVDQGIDGCMIVSVIKQESNFNPNAIGRDREVGLMQIMGRYWYKHFGFKSRAEFEKELKDPEFNILTGTAILKKCLDKKRGSYTKALKCYNGSSSYPPKIMRHYRKTGCSN